jgi:hypothetical protein
MATFDILLRNPGTGFDLVLSMIGTYTPFLLYGLPLVFDNQVMALETVTS